MTLWSAIVAVLSFLGLIIEKLQEREASDAAAKERELAELRATVIALEVRHAAELEARDAALADLQRRMQRYERP